jgi:hypothetical protein
MKFFEITFTGNANSRFNLGGHTLEPMVPKYFLTEELPIPLKDIKKISVLSVDAIELKEKPTLQEAIISGAKAAGVRGLVWVGTSPRRVNVYGVFVKDVPNYSVTDEAFEVLGKAQGFRVI